MVQGLGRRAGPWATLALCATTSLVLVVPTSGGAPHVSGERRGLQAGARETMSFLLLFMLILFVVAMAGMQLFGGRMLQPEGQGGVLTNTFNGPPYRDSADAVRSRTGPALVTTLS